MSYWEFVYISGQWFWQHWSVTLLLALFEGGLFLWFVEPLGERHESKGRRLAEKAVFLALCVLVQLRHMQVVYHCVAFMVLWAGYLLLTHWVSAGQALFFGGIFCLSSELVKLLLKDGVVAGIIAWLIPGIPGGVLNGMILLFYLGMLGEVIYFIRKLLLDGLRSGNGPDGFQCLGLLLPLTLHLFVRSLQFDYMGADSYLWLRLQLIQIANAFCALFIVITAQRSLAATREKNEHLKREMLLREQQRQYLVRKETMETVNRKYHDLKHYLSGIEALAAGGGGVNREVQDYVRAMDREIKPYEQFLDTGNEVLDILLPERIRACQEKEIRLIPLVDGRGLGFISSLDLCALFGNAMDNAMEAAGRVNEPERREIHVRIGVSRGIAMLCFRNFFDGQVKRQGEKLLTRKENTGDHGYGLESIRLLAERYGGTAAYEIQGQEFSLNILIPVPPDNEAGE